MRLLPPFFCFFFNDTPTPEIYTLSLHDALPISVTDARVRAARWVCSTRDRATCRWVAATLVSRSATPPTAVRSEEHTSELQSQSNLVCRLLLEKKKK